MGQVVPSNPEGERVPGIHCLRMRLISRHSGIPDELDRSFHSHAWNVVLSVS